MYEEIRTSRTFQLQILRIASLAAALSSIGTTRLLTLRLGARIGL